MKKPKKTTAKYFSTKKQADTIAKRRGKKVFKMPNGMYFVGTAIQGLKARNSTHNVKSEKLDKKRTAKVPGKRKSKSGKIYYEYRENRTDKNPKKKI